MPIKAGAHPNRLPVLSTTGSILGYLIADRPGGRAMRYDQTTLQVGDVISTKRARLRVVTVIEDGVVKTRPATEEERGKAPSAYFYSPKTTIDRDY